MYRYRHLRERCFAGNGRAEGTAISESKPNENRFDMLRKFIPILAVMPFAWGCASSWPEPKQPMVDAESAARSAREVGADSQPAAKLKVSLADEQIAAAKAAVAKGDNERATYLLVRARADAELALALAHEQKALDEKQKAIAEANATVEPSTQGAKP
jgi:hypothetical protein